MGALGRLRLGSAVGVEVEGGLLERGLWFDLLRLKVDEV